jgi:hypothetical protein
VFKSFKNRFSQPFVSHVIWLGTLDTFWLILADEVVKGGSVLSGSSGRVFERENSLSVASMVATKEARLIDWNVDVLVRLLKQIVRAFFDSFCILLWSPLMFNVLENESCERCLDATFVLQYVGRSVLMKRDLLLVNQTHHFMKFLK